MSPGLKPVVVLGLYRDVTKEDSVTLDPTTQALGWIEQEMERTVQSVSALAGATSSAVYAVDVEGRGGITLLVLFANRTSRSMRSGGRAGAATPTSGLIASDESGQRAGLSVVLMTWLPGSVVLTLHYPGERCVSS